MPNEWDKGACGGGQDTILDVFWNLRMLLSPIDTWACIGN